MANKQYAPDFKRKVAHEVVNGLKRHAQVCREYGLASSVVHRWCVTYRRDGESAWQSPRADDNATLERRVADLERLVGQLTLENSVLKKALQTVPLRKSTP